MTQLTITKPQVLKANRNCQTITFKIEIVLEIETTKYLLFLVDYFIILFSEVHF